MLFNPKTGSETRTRARGVYAAAVSLALISVSSAAWAQDYPTRTINYIVPSSSGSSPDIVGRIMANALSEVLGQPVVVINRPGAGGTVGAAFGAEAPADGYTIVQSNVNHTFSQGLYDDLTYDIAEDLIPVTRFASAFYVFVVNPSMGVETFEELVERIRADPGGYNYASAGVGAATFIVGEVLKSQADLDIVHIPYNGGGPALASIVAGETDLYGSPYGTAKPFLDDGQLVGLAVSSAERIPYLPDYPTVAETVPGFEFTNWYGLMLPAGTPENVIETLHAAAIEALESEEVREQLETLGYILMRDEPEEFAAFIAHDLEVMAQVIEENDLKSIMN